MVARYQISDVRDKLLSLASDLGRWERNSFGNVRKKIEELKAELECLRSRPDRVGPDHIEIKLNENLVELHHREETMWRQRSRIEWLAAGDKNAHFYHQRANRRRRKNLIKCLLNSYGNMIIDLTQLENMTTEFYGNFFTSEGVLDMEDVLHAVPAKVTPAMNSVLTEPYTVF